MKLVFNLFIKKYESLKKEWIENHNSMFWRKDFHHLLKDHLTNEKANLLVVLK